MIITASFVSKHFIQTDQAQINTNKTKLHISDAEYNRFLGSSVFLFIKDTFNTTTNDQKTAATGDN